MVFFIPLMLGGGGGELSNDSLFCFLENAKNTWTGRNVALLSTSLLILAAHVFLCLFASGEWTQAWGVNIENEQPLVPFLLPYWHLESHHRATLINSVQKGFDF